MGKILRLNGVTLTDTTAPKIIERDPIESDGSLFLFDGAHQFGQFSGVPDVSHTIPNVLSNKAAGILSVSESSTDFFVKSRTADSSIWLCERTAKGGIHGLITQSGGQSSSLQYILAASRDIRDYLLATMSSHAFYFSLWTRVTRIGLGEGLTAPQSPFHFALETNNFLFHMAGGCASAGSTKPNFLASKDIPTTNDFNTSGPAAPFARFASLAVQGYAGTGPTNFRDVSIIAGTGEAWDAFNFNKCASRIIYRAYAEDLTVSGRSYSEVEAIDYALWQAAFGPGGKFHGDTYTDPATLP